MLTVQSVILVLAVVCLFLAAIGVTTPRVQLGWLGLFFLAISTYGGFK